MDSKTDDIREDTPQSVRTKIILSSLDDLTKLLEIEKQEKSSVFKLYAALLAGGVTAIISTGEIANTGTTKNQNQVTSSAHSASISSLVLLVILIIIIMNTAILRKFLAIRKASNNIYTAYRSRLRYLIKTNLEGLSNTDSDDLHKSMSYYYEQTAPMKLLPSYSADK